MKRLQKLYQTLKNFEIQFDFYSKQLWDRRSILPLIWRLKVDWVLIGGATFSSLSSTPINGGHDAKIWFDFERLPSLDSLENCPAHSQHPNTRNDHLKKRFWSVFYLGWFTNKVYRNLPANCCLTDVCQTPTEGELSWPATQRTPQCGWQLSYDRKHDAVGVLTRTLEPLMLRWDICEYYGLWK